MPYGWNVSFFFCQLTDVFSLQLMNIPSTERRLDDLSDFFLLCCFFNLIPGGCTPDVLCPGSFMTGAICKSSKITWLTSPAWWLSTNKKKTPRVKNNREGLLTLLKQGRVGPWFVLAGWLNKLWRINNVDHLLLFPCLLLFNLNWLSSFLCMPLIPKGSGKQSKRTWKEPSSQNLIDMSTQKEEYHTHLKRQRKPTNS